MAFARRKRFTLEEDLLIMKLVKESRVPDWRMIASKLDGRSRRACRERYLNHLDPDIKTKDWTEEDDAVLLRAVRSYGRNWLAIQKKYFINRSSLNVKNRWNRVLSKKCDLPESPRARKCQKPHTPIKEEPPSEINDSELFAKIDLIKPEEIPDLEMNFNVFLNENIDGSVKIYI